MAEYITDIAKINEIEWSDYVKNHPKGTIFQTPEMYRVYVNTKNYTPVLVVKVNDQKQITGLILSPIVSEKSGLIGKLTKRSLAYGGPLANTPEDAIDLVTQLVKEIKGEAIYSRILNLYDNKDFLKGVEKIGYVFEEHLNFHFNLTLGADYLWEQISSTRRKQIKRASNRGLTVQITDTVTDINEYYAILVETYQRANLPIIDISLFKNCCDEMVKKNYIKFFTAYDEGKMVAHRIVFTYRDTIYDWYAGNTTESNSKYPNDLLVWEILKYGAENGYKLFDFGGAGKPNEYYGVREFKKRFGGELVNFGYFTAVHNNLVYSLINLAKKIGKLRK